MTWGGFKYIQIEDGFCAGEVFPQSYLECSLDTWFFGYHSNRIYIIKIAYKNRSVTVKGLCNDSDLALPKNLLASDNRIQCSEASIIQCDRCRRNTLQDKCFSHFQWF